MRVLIALVALAAMCGQAVAQPSDADILKYREKLERYLAAGYSPDDTVQGLQSWYGWPFFAIWDYNRRTIDYFVKAPVLGTEIRYLRMIGSVPVDGPNLLLQNTDQ